MTSPHTPAPHSPEFPAPVPADDRLHVYVSVGHQQMMTDAMRPLGWSMWQMIAARPMFEAGGRLFVDVTDQLASPVVRPALLAGLDASDPLIRDALETVLAEGGIELDAASAAAPPAPPPGTSMPGNAPPPPLPTDPAIVAELVERIHASVDDARRALDGLTGPALFDALVDDVAGLKRVLFDPRSMQAIMAGMEARQWLDTQLREHLGLVGAADTLSLAAPGNVTAEMGLALLDVADAVRPHPEVVELLRRRGHDDGFVDELLGVAGGDAARAAIDRFLDMYGVRCVGEIDVTRPRWRERPSALVPVILAHVDQLEAGEHERRVTRGLAAADALRADVLRRLRALPDGAQLADEAERMIDRLRTFVGYREHPKFGIVSRTAVHRAALLREADRLVSEGVLATSDDAWFLTFDELREVSHTGTADHESVRRRRHDHERNRTLTPPRVITSRGTAHDGDYRRDAEREGAPEGALVGLGVSVGVVEGRALVVTDLADLFEVEVEPGDILVTSHTDPSWTPVFVLVSGLVTEVGGMLTHGAVVAREYGLPAVVGVRDATTRLRTGQRIRLDGTAGWVEVR
ncbi:MAG: PEP-utilizing enzyme [Acidimicrobiales bacterium]